MLSLPKIINSLTMEVKPITQVTRDGDGGYTVSVACTGFREKFASKEELLRYVNEIIRQAEAMVDYSPVYLRETPEHKVDIIRREQALRVSGPHGAMDYANQIREQL